MHSEFETGKRMKDVLYAACPNDGSEQPIDTVVRTLRERDCTPEQLLDLTLAALNARNDAGLQLWILTVLFGVFRFVIEERGLDV